eukprot:4276676-Amphidinium_carterae.1
MAATTFGIGTQYTMPKVSQASRCTHLVVRYSVQTLPNLLDAPALRSEVLPLATACRVSGLGTDEYSCGFRVYIAHTRNA